MDKQDFEQFCELWSATCQMCNGKKPGDMVVSLAFEDLSDFTLKEVFDALKKHRLHPDTGKFWPQSQTIMQSIKGGGDLVSQQAWKKVYHALRCIGYSAALRGSWTGHRPLLRRRVRAGVARIARPRDQQPAQAVR